MAGQRWILPCYSPSLIHQEATAPSLMLFSWDMEAVTERAMVWSLCVHTHIQTHTHTYTGLVTSSRMQYVSATSYCRCFHSVGNKYISLRWLSWPSIMQMKLHDWVPSSVDNTISILVMCLGDVEHFTCLCPMESIAGLLKPVNDSYPDNHSTIHFSLLIVSAI